MEDSVPYLVMRSTAEEPLCYGARLYEGDSYDDEDFGSMAWAGDDLAVWDQVCGLVKAAFGDKAAQRLSVDENTTSKLVPDQQCVYVLADDGTWGDRPPRFGQEVSVHYRLPDTHPDEDVWESVDADRFVKVTDDDGSMWFVADLHINSVDRADAYLIIPSDIAKKSLRKAAVAPDVEFQEEVRDFSGLCYFPG